jgi:adhesin/invasin
LWRRFWPLLLVTAGVVTCDAPTSLSRRGTISVAPLISVSQLTGFAGLTVDSVRVTVTRPPNQVLIVKTFPFSPDSAQIQAALTVTISGGHEQLDVLVEFLSNSQVVFTGTQTVDVVAGAPPATPPPLPVTYVGPGSSIKSIHITPRDSNAVLAASVPFTVTAVDSANQPVSSFYVSWSTSATSNTINGAGLFTAGNTPGLAWVHARTPAGIKDSTTVTVLALPPASVTIAAGSGQSATAGAAVAVAPAVLVRDAQNNPMAGVSVTFAVASGGGSITGGTATTNASGVATVGSWTLGVVPGANTLTATVSGLPAVTFTATGTSGAPATVTINAGNNQVAATGAAVAVAPSVLVRDAQSAPVAGVSVTFAVAPGGGAITGAVATTNASGIATVGSWTLGGTPGANTLTATVTGLTPVTFTATGVTPGVPAFVTKVAGDGQTAATGTALPVRPAVKVTDGLGTRVAGVSVTFAVASGGGSITGAAVVADTGGIATVGSWTLGAAVGTNTLTATVTGLTPATFTATGTGGLPTITIVLPGGAVSQGSTVGVPIRLSAPAPAGGVTVTVTSDSTSYLTVASPGTIAFAQGDTVKTINVTGVAAGVSILHASATGYTAATQQVVVTPNVIFLAQNVVVQVGSTANVFVQLSPAPGAGGLTVTLQSTDTTKVKVTTPTVNFGSGQSGGNATVQGVAAGIAGITATATGYATGGTVVTVTGVPTTLTLVSGGNQNGSPSTQLPQPVVVRVTDALGNPVSGFAVTFAVATGGGSVGTPSTTTNASGLASTTWTLGAATGTQTITATASGLTGSPLTVSANAPVIASTTVSPSLDTITAIAATRTLVAQAKDAQNNLLSGSFTWVSRTPAVATVGATGVVRAVTNGSTYVVATETGGTKDSALIVVQQRLATINVVPGARSIYLTRSFTFTASAADGGGTPLPSQPTFTWTTTAPAVATVNSSGLVSAIGLGSAQIRATSGAATGVANVSVITPITRIAVVVDTVGAVKTDTISMASLGLTRRYRAVAHDTLDAVMTGITFTWQSTNGSVAQLLGFANDTASVVSAANGVTNVLAAAQGFTSNPGALLTVQQVLASILLAPDASNPTATIAVTGTVHVSARGQDANNRFISGGSFKYASATPAVATVDSLTGVVTGVANGTSAITATSGAITSNVVTVTVGGAVPSIISFGRDTVSVGRGGNASIPILLSKPAGSPLTVNLTATAFAHWSPASITIPANATSANATLFGDSAGTTIVTATDGSGLGYSAASAVAKVTANMRLTSGGYGINTTDIVTTQVLLSDPSPAGGTYVTFNYSTAGVARVSPDPAFIPAGQLAADIQILAVGAGSTYITPNAIGVNGATSSFTAYAPVLTPSTSFIRLGQGQYEPSVYVYTPTYTNLAVPVTVTSSDTNVATVTPSITIPAGSYYAYFTIVSKATGTANISVSAPGWTGAYAVAVNVTSPRLSICCSNGGLYTTSPQQTFYVYAEDSVGNVHYRVNSLLVHLRSTDTSVIRMIDTVVTIPPGQYANYSGRFVMGGLGGSAYIVATASGHRPDSSLYTVSGPPLYFSWGGTPLVGAGQYEQNQYVYTPNSVTQPLVVTLTNSDTNVVGIPATVTIPTGSYYAYFTVTAKAPGSVTLGANATGYGSVSGSWAVSSPRLTACCNNTLNNFGPGATVYAYTTDSVRNSHYRTTSLTVSMVSTDTTVIKLDSSSVTIPAGYYYTPSGVHVTPVGTGTAKIVFTAPGHPALDTLTFTVVTPTIRFAYRNILLGRRQYLGGYTYIYTPDYRATPLAATIVQKHNTVDTLSSTALTIPTNSYYSYYDVFGVALGTDTLIVSAPGYLPDTAYVTVSTPRLTNCCMPGSATTTNPPFGMTVYATDSLGNAHYVMDTLVIGAVSSDSTVIQPTQRYFRLPTGAYYTQPSVYVTGPGAASITYSDSAGTGYGSTTTGTITVTGPSLSLANGSPVLGMRQHGGTNSSYVYVPNNVATPLVVSLLSTGTRVATVPATITIPTGYYYAYFDVTAQDTIGTIQIQATATGYGGAAMNVQVTQPKFTVSTSTQLNTTSAPQILTIYATDANGTAHYTAEDVTVTLLSSAPSVAGIDSSTVTIVKDNYYTQAARWAPGIVGTAQLSLSDARATYYRYNTGSVNVLVITPSLNFNNYPGVLGLGQYQDYVYPSTPDYQPAALSVAFTHTGTARTGTFANLTNTPITGLTIPQGSYYQYFRMSGLVRGTDTLTASATSPAHDPAAVYTVVDSGRVDPISGWPGTIKAGDSVLVTMYARDPNTSVRYVVAATNFTLAPNSNIEFHVANAVVTQVTIPADAQYVQFYLVGKAAGAGSVNITSATYQKYTNTVTVTP